MLFNSIEFLVFFPVVFLLALLIRGRFRWLLLLAASYFFYMSWRVDYIILILISTFVDYFVTRLMSGTNDTRRRTLLLAFSLLTNLGLLFYFKYLTFFADSANEVFAFIGADGRINAPVLLLPVGISFYTFQTLSYTIDVYRGKVEHEKNPFVFALFVAYFPQLVAGPIERSGNLLPQLRASATARLLDPVRISDGLRLIAWGMFKKVVVADRLALYINPIYDSPDEYRGLSLILATVFFAFQIYCDFSAYSDIAIGVAKFFGVDLSTNFNAPYLARSIPEFWQRWHISLSTWFRDYVYIPLGGNRVSPARWHINILIVFMVSGLWHGANWTFVIWGASHGLLYLAFHHLARIKSPFRFLPQLMRSGILMAITFGFVCLTWIFFRANSLGDAQIILQNFFNFSDGWSTSWFVNLMPGDRLNIVMGLLGISSVFIVDAVLEWTPRNMLMAPRLASIRLAAYVVLICSITLLGAFDSAQEFVYFQF